MFELTGRSTLIRQRSGAVTAVNVGSAVVSITITSVTDTSINVTATISYSDTVILNGTYMDCNGERLYINAKLPSKYFLQYIYHKYILKKWCFILFLLRASKHFSRL